MDNELHSRLKRAKERNDILEKKVKELQDDRDIYRKDYYRAKKNLIEERAASFLTPISVGLVISVFLWALPHYLRYMYAVVGG